MARAESASASAHSDSIKGLAQAVARPAYRRLLTAEPFLRRAVPVLLGEGIRLFDGIAPAEATLVGTHEYGSGLVELRYTLTR